MFDSPLQDWTPGKLVRIGFPWHGRVDLDYSFTGLRSRLNLPNGSVMRVPYINAAPTVGQLQYGSNFFFRDPRALPVVLGPEEAAEAAAAGATWRPQVIINELRLANGVQLSSAVNERAWFVYHSTTQNWLAWLTGLEEVRTQRTPVIGRSGATSMPVVTTITKMFAVGADAPPVGEYLSASYIVIIDALPDGSRQLLAQYRTRSASGLGAAGFESRSERWEPVAFYELRLSGPGNALTAELHLLYGKADIEAGYSLSVVDARGRHTVMATSGFGWSTYDLDAVSYSQASFPRILATPPLFPSPDWYEDGTASVTESHTRVVSMYYGTDLSIKRITWELSRQNLESTDASENIEQTPAEGLGQGGGVFGIKLTAPGFHSFTVNETTNRTSSFSAVLKDDGVEVSAINGSGASSRSREWNYRLDVEANSSGIAITRATSTTTVSVSWSRTMDLDGHTLLDESGGSASSDWILAPLDVWFDRTNPGGGWTWPWVMRAEDSAYDAGRRLCFLPMHYTLQMHGLSSTTWGVMDGSIEDVASSIGNVAHRGTTTDGWRTGALPPRGYFGSHNPVTGQTIRDSATPVTYL